MSGEQRDVTALPLELGPMTLEDHALLAGITDEMIDAAVQASFEAAFREQVACFLGPDWWKS